MDKIIYQSVCEGRHECVHLKAGKQCEHAKPLRRKEFPEPAKDSLFHTATKFACPHDPGSMYTYSVASCSCRKNEYIRWRAIAHPVSFGYVKKDKDQLRDELSKKFNKCYGVFRRHRQTGLIEGYCEASFSMTYDRKNVMPVGLDEAKTTLINTMHGKTKDYNKDYETFIVRITATGKNNPVVINWNANKDGKYSWRNIPFHVKPACSTKLTEELMVPIL